LLYLEFSPKYLAPDTLFFFYLSGFGEKGDSQKNFRNAIARVRNAIAGLRNAIVRVREKKGTGKKSLNGRPLHEKELSINNYQLSINDEREKGDSQKNFRNAIARVREKKGTGKKSYHPAASLMVGRCMRKN